MVDTGVAKGTVEGSGLTRSVPHAQGFWVECSLHPFSLAPPPRSLPAFLPYLCPRPSTQGPT